MMFVIHAIVRTTTHQKQKQTNHEKSNKYSKENLSRNVFVMLYGLIFFNDSRVGMCQCCLREQITIGNFHAGHIIAHANGGLTTLDNLTPICMLCNTSMGPYDLNEFIKKYNLHHGL